MGNDASTPVRNLDKRTARRRYRDDFADAIAEYRVEEGVYPYPPPPSPPRHEDGASGDRFGGDGGRSARSIRVFVRKRPINVAELDSGEFDVISCNGATVTLHDARMHSDMQRQILHHHSFAFDGVFHEDTVNETVFEAAVAGLIPLACTGKVATAMAYGQTGSGKTYTMTSVYDHAATALFEELGEDPADVTLLFLELTNTRCSDLFGEGKSIKLVDGTAVGATEVSVASAEEMMEFIQFGNRVRRTEETGVHAASSRSHSVLQIHIRRGRGIETEGCLVLVDLAGSEQAIDSAYHNAQRQKEGAAINSSLSALKGCIRARAAGSEANHHYRKSVLTMALKASFTSPEAATVIIATASPASKDTEHTLNTLRHACIMHGNGAILDANIDVSKVGSIKTVQLGRIDVKAEYLRGKEEQKQAHLRGSNTFGADAMRSNGNERNGKYGVAHTAKELAKQQRKAERAAMRRLHPAYVERLVAAREDVVKDNRRQQERVMKARLSREVVEPETESPPRRGSIPRRASSSVRAAIAAPPSDRMSTASRSSMSSDDECAPRRQSHQHRDRDLPSKDSGSIPRRSADSSRRDSRPTADTASQRRSSAHSRQSHEDERGSSRSATERGEGRRLSKDPRRSTHSGRSEESERQERRSKSSHRVDSVNSGDWDDGSDPVDDAAVAHRTAPPRLTQKEKAAAAEERRQAAFATKRAQKGAKKSASSGGNEIERLEAAIAAEGSAATRAGLKRRLAGLKGAHIRDQRKRESAARAAGEVAAETAKEHERRGHEAAVRAAAEAAVQAAEAEEAAENARLAKKQDDAFYFGLSPEPDDKDGGAAGNEIAQLEAAIADEGSSAARSGLKRRLATLKAAKIREKRKKESAARAAGEVAAETTTSNERQSRDAAVRAAAGTAKEATRADKAAEKERFRRRQDDANSSGLAPDPKDAAGKEIAQLEAAIAAELSSAARSGLKRRLATLKAAKIRETRKRESVARAAAGEAAEAAEEDERRRRDASARAAANAVAEEANAVAKAAEAAERERLARLQEDAYNFGGSPESRSTWLEDDNGRRSTGSPRGRGYHKEPAECKPRRTSELDPLHGSPSLARKWGSHSSHESTSSPYGRKSSSPAYDAYGRRAAPRNDY